MQPIDAEELLCVLAQWKPSQRCGKTMVARSVIHVMAGHEGKGTQSAIDRPQKDKHAFELDSREKRGSQ
tara:strand:- start:345 stop:551 length:207 start_codon:yes stop_codon:yes gene_type:complete